MACSAKHAGGALFDQDQPWEQRIDNGYPNVVYAPGDPGGDWKLWYGTCFEPHNCGKQLLLFANSSDGIAWTKPHLGRYDLAAVFPALAKLGKANNIVMYGGGLGVYRDEHEPDSYADVLKYKRIEGDSDCASGCDHIKTADAAPEIYCMVDYAILQTCQLTPFDAIGRGQMHVS